MKRRKRSIQIGFFGWGLGHLIYVAPFLGITYVPPLGELVFLFFLVGWVPLALFGGGFTLFGFPKGFARMAFVTFPKPFALILATQFAWILMFETEASAETVSLFSPAGIQNMSLVLSFFYGFITCFQLWAQRLAPLLKPLESEATDSNSL